MMNTNARRGNENGPNPICIKVKGNNRKALAPIDTTNNANNKLQQKKIQLKKANNQIQNRQSLKPIQPQQVDKQSVKTNTNKQSKDNVQKKDEDQVFTIFCDEEVNIKSEIKENEEFTIFCDESIHEKDEDLVENIEIDEEKSEVNIVLNELKIEEKENGNSSESCQSNSIEESIVSMIIEEDRIEEEKKESEKMKLPLTTETYDDLLMKTCAQYMKDIDRYLLESEIKFRPNPFYMSKQHDINSKMRSILVDWLVEVADEYNMHCETLFLAVNCVDRFLSLMSITRQNFQLLGTSALFVVSKYEEIYPPDIHEFVYITDDTYNKHQVLGMEKLILKVLQFDISSPTVYYFLKKFSIQMNLPKKVEQLAEYLSFLCLLEDQPFLRFFPSVIALSCIIFAIDVFNFEYVFTQNDLERFVNLKSGSIKEARFLYQICLQSIFQLQSFASQHAQQAIYHKYSLDKHSNVAQIKVKTLPSVKKYF